MQIPVLKREVGPKGATIIGLGSMLGTGVYIALGLASGFVGYYIFLSIFIEEALLYATVFPALSSQPIIQPAGEVMNSEGYTSARRLVLSRDGSLF